MPGNPVEDPRDLLLAAPMSRFQVLAVGITVLLCALDGYDVLAITFAAPGIAQEWGTSKAALGIAMSMGLVGMACGSLLIAPLADIIGRRRMIFITLILMATGMTACGLATNVAQISAWRLVTGLGIGGMVAIINPLAAEYANGRRRDLAVALMGIGYPIGGVLGGSVAAILLEHYDWPAVFYLGAGAALVMLPICAFSLPEPIGFLIERPKAGALARVNWFLERCGHPPVNTLPAPTKGRGVPLAEVFRPALRGATIAVTAIYLLQVLTVYYYLSWLPQLVADSGFSHTVAVQISVCTNIGGVVGGLAIGWGAQFLGLRTVVTIGFLGLAAFSTLFALAPADIDLFRASSAVAGFFAFASMIGMYAIIARTFPARVRATGTGFVIGVGRGGAALAPVLGGMLFDAGLSRLLVTALMACGAIAAAGVLNRFSLPSTSAANRGMNRLYG
jgi:benzoate transport